MSRSYRKPYSTFASKNKKDKKLYVKAHRAKTRQAIISATDPDEIQVPKKNIETSDVWSMSCDGKPNYIKKPREHDSEWLKKYYKRIKRK